MIRHRRAVGHRLRRERGSGSVLAVAVLGAIVLVSGAAVLGLGALAAQQGVQAAADAGALAAADTLSGRNAGYPCENAARAAALDQASITSCETDGLVAVVAASRGWSRFELSARARAGPPGTP
ncbi:Rv3654c family TadE-like protein [Gryllotalpicola protaetiae]|uniref:Rv3654c family TadE-like protein n=1 Tax=Gryllotalpicola protaetiae TaxID=2419771 RepID=UPI0013C4CF6E|nr:Rv3654c family TadE-like protein [Gryllotalpicola protaetiae]